MPQEWAIPAAPPRRASRLHLRTLVTLAVLSSATLVPSAQAAAKRAPVAAFNFDQLSGTVVKDQSGHGRDGSAAGVTPTAGRNGGAIVLTGSKSYVSIADKSLRVNRAMTIEAWVRSAAVAKASKSARKVAARKASLTAGVWTHVATTWDGSVARTYVNGRSVSSSKTQPKSAKAPLRIDGSALGTDAFKGAVDDVRVYDRALSAKEISADAATPVASLAGGLLAPVAPLVALADTQPPAVPQGMAWTTTTSNSIGLRWNATSDNTGVAGYRIYRDGVAVGTTTNLTYTVTGLACNTSYTIGLTAYDAAGNESYRPEATGTTTTSACPDTQAPSAPSGITWTSTSQTALGVRWNASTDNTAVAGYRVYRNGVALGTTTGQTYNVTGLSCNTGYAIGVVAYDAAGNESSRTEATGTTSACPTPTPTPDRQAPSVPQGMAWTTTTQNSIGVRWNASTDNTGVAGYRIYRDGVAVGTTTSLSYSVTGLACNTSYQIGLTAYDAAGNESYRPEATGTTTTSACPATPTPTPTATATATPTSTPTATPTATATATPTVTPTPTPPAGSANRFITPSGSDSASCTSAAPCKTFARAYQVAAAGDVISVGAGTYTAQNVPSGSKAVTFRGVEGNVIRALDNSAANVTFDNLQLDGNFAQNAVLENHGAANVTYKNGSVGRVTDEKGALISGENFTFDNVVFHDAVMQGQGVHMECVYAIGVPGFTVRNSTFRDCAIMDLAFTYGDWWTPLPPPYGNVTIENNVFQHPEQFNNSGWHHYSLNIGSVAQGGGSLTGWTVRYNTFENTVGIYPKSASGSRWVANLGTWSCVPGMTYSRNVGKKCGSTDKEVSPAGSTQSTPAAQGWINPAAGDFRLQAGAPAVDAGDPNDKPATDRDGKPRGAAPDAGAYER